MIDDLQTAPLTAANFNHVRDFVEKEAAIVLAPGKEYLVETRLASIATRNSCASVNALVDQLRALPPGRDSDALRSSIIDALTTNETLFFRDLNPFEALREHIIPEFRRRCPGQAFNLWSAASSTGQEAYSVAMLLAENFPDLRYRLVGTDLSPTVIQKARAGVYQQLEVNRGLPAKLLVKYFTSGVEGWRIDEKLRGRVEFGVLNLIRAWPPFPPFHVVMLRNVMIYFDVETRRRLLARVREVLAPGGYLVLGGAETPVILDPAFVPVSFGKATFYRVAPK